ncbi:MAG: hypothetical protein MEQ07_05490 [Aquimonas sp.]|nr:hypothetical protein [Aquimonas sp.]
MKDRYCQPPQGFLRCLLDPGTVSVVLLLVGLSPQSKRTYEFSPEGGHGVWELQLGLISPLLTRRARGEGERIEDIVWHTEHLALHPLSFSALCVALGLGFLAITAVRTLRQRRCSDSPDLPAR